MIFTNDHTDFSSRQRRPTEKIAEHRDCQWKIVIKNKNSDRFWQKSESATLFEQEIDACLRFD